MQCHQPSPFYDQGMTHMVEMMEGISLSQRAATMGDFQMVAPMCTETAAPDWTGGASREALPEYAHVYHCEDQWAGTSTIPFDPDQHEDGTGQAFLQQMQWCIQNDLAISVNLAHN